MLAAVWSRDYVSPFNGVFVWLVHGCSITQQHGFGTDASPLSANISPFHLKTIHSCLPWHMCQRLTEPGYLELTWEEVQYQQTYLLVACNVLVSDCHDPYHKSHKNWGLMFKYTYQVQCIISTLSRVCVSCVSIPKMNRGLNSHCPYPAMQNILEWILYIMLELRKWFYVLINTDVLFVNPQRSYIVHI